MTSDKQKSTCANPLKCLHSRLSSITAEHPEIMWATMITSLLNRP